MPEHNLIQRPDLVLRLQSFFGLRQHHVTPTLGSVVQPVVVVANLESGDASRVAEGLPLAVLNCAGLADQAAVVGQFSMIMLSNPAGSGRLLRLVAIFVGSIAGQLRMQIMIATAPLALPVATTAIDTRFKRQAAIPLGAPSAILSIGSQVVNPGAVDGRLFWFGDAGFTTSPNIGLGPLHTPNLPIILDEGDGLLLFHPAVNSRLVGTIFWNEIVKAT